MPPNMMPGPFMQGPMGGPMGGLMQQGFSPVSLLIVRPVLTTCMQHNMHRFRWPSDEQTAPRS